MALLSWRSKETERAIARGEAVGLFTGRPKGRPTWSDKSRPEWDRWAGRD